MIKNVVTINKEVIKEMSKKSIIISSLIGGICTASCVPFLVLYLLNQSQIYFVIIFTVLLAFGAIGLYNLYKVLSANRKARKIEAVFEYDIFNDRIIIHTKNNEGKKNDIQIEYNQIAYYKKTNKHLYIHLPRNYSFPLLIDENIEEIEKILNDKDIKRK